MKALHVTAGAVQISRQEATEAPHEGGERTPRSAMHPFRSSKASTDPRDGPPFGGRSGVARGAMGIPLVCGDATLKIKSTHKEICPGISPRHCCVSAGCHSSVGWYNPCTETVHWRCGTSEIQARLNTTIDQGAAAAALVDLWVHMPPYPCTAHPSVAWWHGAVLRLA